MVMTEYETIAQRTITAMGAEAQLNEAALGLTAESGEVANIVKRNRYQGYAIDKDHIIEELGDVYWYLMEAAFAIGSSLDEIAEFNLTKIKLRYPEQFKEEHHEADRC